MASKIYVKQIRSPIRRPEVQRKILKGLGLNKMNKVSEARDDFLKSYHNAKQQYLEETIKALDGDDKQMWKAVKRFNKSQFIWH